MSLIKTLFPGVDFYKLVEIFRLYLAIFEVPSLFLLNRILTVSLVKRPLLWILIIGLLPSLWVGGSVWRQIDGIGQTLLLSIFYFSFQCLKPAKGRTSLGSFYLLVAISIVLLILTKQISCFRFLP